MTEIANCEAQVWETGASASALASYRDALPVAGRHEFIVVIPVADRPEQLRAVLDSLLGQCRDFRYGGMADGQFCKVRALIADDSASARNVAANRNLAEEFSAQGLNTEYFGTDAQHRCLAALPDRGALDHVLGARAAHPHKGASVSRNLAYLRLAELATPDRLFFFVDSDEQFKVRIPDGDRGRDVNGISYFHTLDRIFSRGDVDVLTGKVVGDPPVSPAVMAGNFLDDVLLLLNELSDLAPSAACTFHGDNARQANDAAYHDMADLFGFKPAEAFRYRCTRNGDHDHRDCLAGFAAHLDRFFDGEHPTRLSHFEYLGSLDDTTPARTVYTGNYVINTRGLEHFIPFAPLKLRMAGPVLGRLIKARLGGRFVSANLPLLHTRTAASSGRAEFRPGVDRVRNEVDLSGEFERQFWGDVMLFTVERLIAEGYPETDVGRAAIEAQVDAAMAELEQRYIDKQRTILVKLERVQSAFSALTGKGFNDAQTSRRFDAFIANIARNFGGHEGRPGVAESSQARRAAICDALLALNADRAAWSQSLTAIRSRA